MSEEVKLLDFGRRAVLSVRQNLISKVLDIEKEDLYETYKEKVGTIVTGEVLLSTIQALLSTLVWATTLTEFTETTALR